MPYRRVFRNFLKVEPEERWKATLFALLAALLQVGVALGISGSDSLFLTHVGADKLPINYVVTPILLLLYIPALSYLTPRFGINRIMDLTLLMLAGSALSFFFLLHHPTTLLFYAIKLFSNVWHIALYTLYWNFTDNYFDIQDGKRLFPIFSGGAAAGTLIGGAMVSGLMNYYSVSALFLVWAILAGLSIPVGWAIRRNFAPIEVLSENEDGKRLPQELRETIGFFQKFRYVRLLVIIVFLLAALTTVNEYHYSTIFAQGRSDVQLASLFGQLYALANVLSLFINLFIFPRAVLSLGVGNMALVAPVVLLVAYLCYLLDYGMRAGLVGFFAINGVVAAVDYNNWNLLYNGVPVEARRQVRTVLNGLVDPATISIVGILLLVGASLITPDRLSVIGTLSSVVMLAFVFSLRNAYRRTTADNLKREWLDFSRSEAVVLGTLGAGEQRVIAAGMREVIAAREASGMAGREEMLRTGIRILWLNNHLLATDSLLEYLSGPTYSHTNGPNLAPASAADSEVRTGSDRLLSAEESLLEMALSSNDSAVIRRVLPWLDPQERMLQPGWICPLGKYGLVRPQDVAQLLGTPDPEIQGAAASALWHSWRTEDRQRAFEVVRGMLASGEPRAVAAAVRSLGHSGQERMAYQLLSSRLVPALLRAIARADGDDRAIGLEALAAIQDTDCIAPLLALGERFTPYERRIAERVLVGIGLKSVPTLVSLLSDPQNSRRGRSIAARALSKLSPPQLEAVAPEIILTELRGVYALLERYATLPQNEQLDDSNAGIGLLRRFYLDQRRVGIDFVLEVLTLEGQLPDFELISASLFSSARKVRGNAIETIEQGTSRAAFRLLLPLIDGRSATQCLEWYHSYLRPPGTDEIATDAADQRLQETLNASLESGTALECAAAAQALWHRQGPEAMLRLRRRLHNRDSAFNETNSAAIPPLLRSLVLTLLARGDHESHTLRVGTAAPSISGTSYTSVEKMLLLSQSSFFRNFTVFDLEAIAPRTSVHDIGPGESVFRAGESAEELYVIVRGTAQLGTKENPRGRRQSGDVIGKSALFGTANSRGELVFPIDAVAETTVRLIAIPAEALHRAARRVSHIGTALLQEKVAWLGSARDSTARPLAVAGEATAETPGSETAG
ncbi:MAG: Npt1/Npt2 family nucleotide transporter [Armatimonadota bacterium]